MSTHRSLSRIGAGAALVGAPLLLLSTVLYPIGADPNDAPAAFGEYAADSMWIWSHLGQFLGLAILGVALVALVATFEPGRPAAWGRIATIGTAAIVAVAAALQAVDGVALKSMVDRWAGAAGPSKAMAFEAAFAVRQVEIGLASLLSIVTGLTLVVFGAGMMASSRYPRWLGGIGLLGGIGSVLAGVLQASTGFSEVAMTLSMVASLVLVAWVVASGVLLWRHAPEGHAD